MFAQIKDENFIKRYLQYSKVAHKFPSLNYTYLNPIPCSQHCFLKRNGCSLLMIRNITRHSTTWQLTCVEEFRICFAGCCVLCVHAIALMHYRLIVRNGRTLRLFVKQIITINFFLSYLEGISRQSQSTMVRLYWST